MIKQIVPELNSGKPGSIFKELCSIAFLLLLSSWPLFLFLLDGVTIYSNSQLNFSLPLRFNAIESILNGNLPLWNPHMFNGMPLLGDSSSMPLDPFGILLMIFSPVFAFVLLPVVQLFLAGLFMYIYLYKGLGLGRIASLTGGVLAIFNPVLLFGVGVPLDNHIPFQGILFLPLIMFFVERSVRGDRYSAILNSIYTGLALSLAFFSTYPNMALFLAIFIFFYLFFYKTDLRRKIQILVIVVVVAGMLTSIQVLPTMEVIKSSHRTHLWEPSGQDIYGYSLKSLRFSFFHGMFKVFGLSRGFKYYHPFYLGIFNTLLLLIVYSFKTTKNSFRSYKKLFIFLLSLMVISYYVPLKGFIAIFLPFIQGLRIGHMAFVVYFCAFVLISKSIDSIVSGQCTRRQIKLTHAYILLCSLGFLKIFATRISAVDTLRDSVSNGTVFYITSYFIIFIFSFILLLKLMNGSRKRAVMAVFLMLMIAGNLFIVWKRSFFAVSSTQLADLYDITPETEFLKGMTSFERMEIYYGQKRWKWNQTELKQGCTMNLPMFFNASISGGQLPMHHVKDRIFFDAVNGRYPFDKEWYWKDGHYIRDSGRVYLEEDSLQNPHMLDLLGINYILSAEKLSYSFLEPVADGSNYFIYKNKNAFPRCFAVTSQTVLENEEAVLEAIFSNRYDLKETVLCTSEILSGSSTYEDSGSDPSLNIEVYKPNFIQLRVINPKETVLVLTDSFDPGWTVCIDGKPDTVHVVNYKFRGIRVEPGEHVVTLRYLPQSFIAGAITTSCGSILIFATILLIKFRIRKGT